MTVKSLYSQHPLGEGGGGEQRREGDRGTRTRSSPQVGLAGSDVGASLEVLEEHPVDVGVEEHSCVCGQLRQMNHLSLLLQSVALIHPYIWQYVFRCPVQQNLHFPRVLLPPGYYRAVEDHTVSVAQALDVCCQVEADGSMANGIHGLSVKEVMRSGERASVFVLEFPPLVEAGLGRRLFLQFALTGHFG